MGLPREGGWAELCVVLLSFFLPVQYPFMCLIPLLIYRSWDETCLMTGIRVFCCSDKAPNKRVLRLLKFRPREKRNGQVAVGLIESFCI